MLLRLLCPLATFAALGTAVCAQDGVMIGRMEGDTYLSPTGEFKIPAPVLTELGGTISDTENVVTFQDRYNTHISIACFPQDASQRWELDTRGLRDYLLYFFSNFVQTDFQRRFPGSGIESARFLPDLLGGTVITFTLLPGGSYFEGRNRILGAAADNPVTAKRGTLLFVRSQHIYIISTELAERATQRSTYRKTVDEEDQLLTDRLTTLAGRLVFTSAKPRNP